MMAMRMVPLTSLEEALVLASIRNECRRWMTNYSHEIKTADQIRWFSEFYLTQCPVSYRVWLLKENQSENESIIGYFAAKEVEEGFYITEGVSQKKRGIGAGKFILNSMLNLECFKKKTIYADILNSNSVSIHFHEKFGFKEYLCINSKITRYVLRVKS